MGEFWRSDRAKVRASNRAAAEAYCAQKTGFTRAPQQGDRKAAHLLPKMRPICDPRKKTLRRTVEHVEHPHKVSAEKTFPTLKPAFRSDGTLTAKASSSAKRGRRSGRAGGLNAPLRSPRARRPADLGGESVGPPGPAQQPGIRALVPRRADSRRFRKRVLQKQIGAWTMSAFSKSTKSLAVVAMAGCKHELGIRSPNVERQRAAPVRGHPNSGETGARLIRHAAGTALARIADCGEEALPCASGGGEGDSQIAI